MNLKFRLGCVPILGLVASAAWGQCAYFASPERFSAPLGAASRVRVLAGQPAEAALTAWPEVRWAFSRSPGAQENFDGVRPAVGQDSVGFATGRAGVTVIGLDLKPRVLELTEAEWSAFTAAHLLKAPPERSKRVSGGGPGRPAEARVRVRQVASAKTLVRVVDGAEGAASSAEAMSKAGLKAEIRAGLDPTRLQVGGDLPLMIYADNIKRRVRVSAANAGGDAVQTVDIGEGGLAVVRVTHAGVWRVAFHFAEPAGPEDGEVDYVLYSGTLTFEVPEVAK